MFQSVRIAASLQVDPPAQAPHVIRFMFGKPLDFTPGERYAYSNFGYCLLGRIIEVRSGKSYEQFVREQVLSPLAIDHMRIGKTRDRSSFEVRYYDPQVGEGPSVFAADVGQAVPHPYGAWYLEAMDAHGGWIGSAVELVRFAAAVHTPGGNMLINDASRELTLAPPEGPVGHNEEGRPRDVYYGLGWQVKSGDAYRVAQHTGSLPGTSTILVSRSDGRHFAVLFNSRNSQKSNERLSSLAEPILHEAIDQIREWPQHVDHFKTYQ
jgi:N-acyl-D-amino-acid deacylase